MTVPPTPDIVELFPLPSAPLPPEELLALYAPDRATPRLRVNFVQSLDGSATVDGLSGSLGGPADKVVFDILRGVSDVVLVGAGTARAEGYGALTVDERFHGWREALRMPVHPAMALVSGRLDLDPASDLFAKAPRRPLVFTSKAAPPDARRRLAPVADVVDAGDERVDPALVVRELHERGLTQILCEGGPSFFGDLIAADLVDELCLTISPVLEGGIGPRIARAGGDTVVPRHLELAGLLRSGSLLLSRWARAAR
ncbi:pyrimidine reductase family protein [Herbiconiux sp. VKM Ac-2851]|uniref:pyrimidine reductase family protein n=1 Tax=Herbiconiux sp. VKM Ac-2851 TaxID=2739025 RepID=UPI001565CB2B|nr:pyrimidine reductase family protein [Herbiconiux sp. VKM Ac-2851]NQX33426.1 pyrimidine reductase family protein [Herbiconiux sp. VKM Ac-2851]